MSILLAVRASITAFYRESARKPCEIALDAKVFLLLEQEVGMRAVVTVHAELVGGKRALQVRYAERPSIMIDGVRIVRCEPGEEA